MIRGNLFQRNVYPVCVCARIDINIYRVNFENLRAEDLISEKVILKFS